jgi:hypothetical protein
MDARKDGKGWSPGAWAARQKPTALLVVRLLLIANAIVLSTVAGLYLVFASRPAGVVVAGCLAAVVVALLVLLPYTDPRRGSGSRW